MADQIYAELMDAMQSSAEGFLDPATFHRRFQEKLEAALGHGPGG